MFAAKSKLALLPNFARSYATASSRNEVVIVSAARTPIGCFNGSLRKFTAPQLGAIAVRSVIDRAGLKPDQVEEVFIGNVLQANLGQAPARQVALGAGCPYETEATTINKVCSSGMKAVILATQSLELGAREIMVAGGMESMSNTPYYSSRNLGYGHQQLTDSIIKDGLWDVYNQVHMGNCAENTAAKLGISREDQDAHAIESYRRAAAAWSAGRFAAEIVPVTIKDKKGETVINEDEEYKNVKFDKIPSLKPVFQSQGGTVTAANASTLNDGASALLLTTRAKAQQLGLKPLAHILGYGDAAMAPIDFPIAPSKAVPVALARAGIKKEEVALWELNEAFSVVARANEKLLGLDPAKVSILGGAVALGHPIGSSGSRILVTLVHSLESGQVGVAGICNGGGGASAIVVRRE